MGLYLESKLRAGSTSFHIALAVALAGTVFLSACDEDDSESGSPGRAEVAVAEGAEEVVSTDYGRWRILADSPNMTATDLTLSVSKFAREDPLTSLDFSVFDWRMAPVIENLSDLSQFSGVALEGRVAAMLVGPEFQPVPGLPGDVPEFAVEKFKAVREGFTLDCIREAGQYTNAFLKLTTADDLMDMFRGNEIPRASDAYEAHCLTPLATVPLGVRNVVGVLGLSTIRGTIFFCSATIVAERRLLTARHCFFDTTSGQASESWAGLNSRRVTFYTVVQHSGVRKFTVEALDPEEAVGEFAAFDDHLQLKVIGGPFEHVVEVGAQSLTDLEIPSPAWIIGSNALLGDVTRAPSALSYVRGSGPESCAVVGVTAAGCLYHSCQTGVTTSGAGVLVQKPDGYVLVGVHKGAISEAARCEADPPLDLDLNLAAEFTESDFLGV